MFVFAELSCLLLAALWSPVGKDYPLGSLVCDVFLRFCHFPIWCPWSGVGLGISIPDILFLSYFV